MVELGILRPDEPIELIEGELLVVAPQGPLHASRIMALQVLLGRAYDSRASLRVQLPLDSADDSLPEPDLALVRGAAADYTKRHPSGTEALLVIEVAQSSQAYDRDKARVYARMGVPEYWLLDLAAGRLEVRREPSPDGSYGSVQVLPREARVDLPGTPHSLPVSDLLG